jgi:hypothetical protein
VITPIADSGFSACRSGLMLFLLLKFERVTTADYQNPATKKPAVSGLCVVNQTD